MSVSACWLPENLLQCTNVTLHVGFITLAFLSHRSTSHGPDTSKGSPLAGR